MEPGFNVVAVLLASVATMALGGLWYSPLLFEKPWRRLIAASENEKPANPAIVYGGSFALIVAGAAIFHAFLGPSPDFAFAAGVGFAAGLTWAAGSLWISYLFEGRGAGLYLINGGFHILQYTIYGIVFGLM